MSSVNYVKVYSEKLGKEMMKPEKIAYSPYHQKLGKFHPIEENETSETVSKKVETKKEVVNEELELLRTEYEEVVKKPPHPNMKAETMKRKISEIKNQE